MSGNPPDVTDLVAVTLARMEGKLDRMGDKIAALASDRADHESRLRALETRPVVTPRGLATVLTVIGSVVGAAGTVLAVILA